MIEEYYVRIIKGFYGFKKCICMVGIYGDCSVFLYLRKIENKMIREIIVDFKEV